jgi:hypothetical protein
MLRGLACGSLAGTSLRDTPALALPEDTSQGQPLLIQAQQGKATGTSVVASALLETTSPRHHYTMLDSSSMRVWSSVHSYSLHLSTADSLGECCTRRSCTVDTTDRCAVCTDNRNAARYSLQSYLVTDPVPAVIMPEGQRWQGVRLERSPSLHVPMGQGAAGTAALAA